MMVIGIDIFTRQRIVQPSQQPCLDAHLSTRKRGGGIHILIHLSSVGKRRPASCGMQRDEMRVITAKWRERHLPSCQPHRVGKIQLPALFADKVAVAQLMSECTMMHSIRSQFVGRRQSECTSYRASQLMSLSRHVLHSQSHRVVVEASVHLMHIFPMSTRVDMSHVVTDTGIKQQGGRTAIVCQVESTPFITAIGRNEKAIPTNAIVLHDSRHTPAMLPGSRRSKTNLKLSTGSLKMKHQFLVGISLRRSLLQIVGMKPAPFLTMINLIAQCQARLQQTSSPSAGGSHLQMIDHTIREFHIPTTASTLKISNAGHTMSPAEET